MSVLPQQQVPSRAGNQGALLEAAADGDTQRVSALLIAGTVFLDDEDKAALYAAAEGGHTEVVSVLLKANIRTSHDRSRSALRVAAERGHAEVVSILLKADVKPSDDGRQSALRAAAWRGHTEVVSILLKAGVKPSGDGYGSALRAAAIDGQAEVVSILLKAGVKPLDDGAGSALQTAAMGGHSDVVSILLEAGAKPLNDGGGSALRAAAIDGHAGVVSILLEAGVKPSDDDDRSALRAAARRGHTEVVSILLRAGFKLSNDNDETILYAAAKGYIEVVSVLLETNDNSALRTATRAGDAAMISILVNAGANINALTLRGTVLQQAAWSGNADIVKALISQGADPNLLGPFREPCGESPEKSSSGQVSKGFSWSLSSMQPISQSTRIHGKKVAEVYGPLVKTWPLCIAAKRGHAAVVQALLSCGAQIDIGSPDKTAIRAAANEGHKDVVQILLDCGMKIDARDTQGRTCLTWGISHPGVVQILLEKGASMHLQALDGATPLHYAVRDFCVESVGLLLNAGANFETQDYSSRKPLDIVLLDSNPSPVSIELVKLFLKHGCDVGRKGMNSWRAILEANSTDIVEITEIPAIRDENNLSGAIAHGKSSITVALIKASQKPPCFNVPDPELPGSRKLYSAPGAQILFPALDSISTCKFSRQDTPDIGSVIEWQWFQLDEFGIPYGYGLSNAERLYLATDKQAFLSCYACFEWFYPRETETGRTSDSSVQTLDKTFQVQLRKSEISWIMRKPCISLHTQTNPIKCSTASISPIFRSEDFRSTLDIGWIPNSGVDFFTLFILDSHRKWRTLLEKAGLHLTKSRKILLRKKGKTSDFIDNLLFDAQQWSNFRALLQIHVRKAKDLVQDFEERQFLCAEIGDEKDQKNSDKSARETAIVRLSKTIERMESEVEDEIKKLDGKTKEMIELEFNLVSIYEARTSKIMGMSMKRLSWITFIFLPLMFVASLFGMNVDVINDSGPRWWWVIVLSAVLFVIAMLSWCLMKIIRAEGDEDENATISRKLEALLGRSLQKRARRFTDDLESEKEAMSGAYEFKPPPRRWTKLKEL